MKIKRWAIYDGITGDYFVGRYVFRRNAEREVNRYITRLNFVMRVAYGVSLKQSEIDSVRVVELA